MARCENGFELAIVMLLLGTLLSLALLDFAPYMGLPLLTAYLIGLSPFMAAIIGTIILNR